MAETPSHIRYIDAEHLIYMDLDTHEFRTTFGHQTPTAARVWRYVSLAGDDIGMAAFRDLCPDYDYYEISPEKKLENRGKIAAQICKFFAVVGWLLVWLLFGEVFQLDLKVTMILVLVFEVLFFAAWAWCGHYVQQLQQWVPPRRPDA